MRQASWIIGHLADEVAFRIDPTLKNAYRCAWR
jgi:hypothetical protein